MLNCCAVANKFYQPVNSAFNLDQEFAIDTCYCDMPPVNNEMFTISRKFIINKFNSILHILYKIS